MIPLLQHVLGGPGPAPVPAEIAVEGDGFAALMDQPMVTPTDGAAVVVLMSVVPKLPLPPATAQAGSDAAPCDDVALGPFRLPTADPVASGSFDVAAVSSWPAPDSPDAPQPPPQQTLAPPTVEVADPGKRIASAPPEGDVQAALSPKPHPATLNEVAFMARIDPQAEGSAPAQVPDPKMVAVIPANPPLRPIRQTAPLQAILESTAKNPRLAQETVKPPIVPIAEVADDDVQSPVVAIGDSGPIPTPDPKAAPEPPIVLQAVPDRPSQTPPAVAVPLPPTVPMALMVHAHQAALGPVEVVLNPEELGKVRFEIHQQGDQVRVVLTVERPETLDLLRRHADLLVQEFRAAGYTGASLSFGNWGGQQGATSGQTAGSEPDPVATDAPNLSPPPSRNFAPSTGLNLRL